MDTIKHTKQEATNEIKNIREFVSAGQLNAIADGCRGEEKQFFFDKIVEIANIIKTMPKTYEQDGKKNQAVAYLHYFRGNADWYITEKDIGSPEEPGQRQAFGRADLGFGYPEMGYISIPELIGAGVELDLYFSPKTLEEIDKEV